MGNTQQRISALEQKIQAIDAEREALLNELSALKDQVRQQQDNLVKIRGDATVNHQSSSQEKVSLFGDLFKGRTDIFPKRWENGKTGKSGYSPACANEWKPTVCEKPRIKCGDCKFRSFIPVNDTVIANHLAGKDNQGNRSGDFVIGVYPLMQDERCWFLAVDFDKASWQLDVGAFAGACQENGIPYSVEISRSGKGAHIWLFFSSPVLALEARKLGTYLLTQAMDKHPELGNNRMTDCFPTKIPCQKAASAI